MDTSDSDSDGDLPLSERARFPARSGRSERDLLSDADADV